MCGIVGGVSDRDVVPVLLEGLKRLEYRGYDSCGVAVFDAATGALRRTRSTRRVSELVEQVRTEAVKGFTGIAHTRWATHGAPVTENAHPHVSCSSNGQARIALVHNGIIENHDVLRDRLIELGYRFESETDTEVIAHLIHHHYEDDLLTAVQATVRELKGAYAIAVLCRDEPHRIVAARDGSPLVLGVGEKENYVASDALALTGVTNQIVYLEDGDVVDLQPGAYWLSDAQGQSIERTVQTIEPHSTALELGPYRHYMHKEIFEQPRAVADTIDEIQSVMPEIFGDGAYDAFRQTDRVLILACGTSYYAGMTAKYWLESIAKIPTSVEIASEYRYRDSVPSAETLVVTISQSGETADTLSALKHAQSLGMHNTLAICNVPTSALVRNSRFQFLTRAGVEVGVASTKAFATQLMGLFVLTLAIAQTRGHLDEATEAQYIKAMRHIPVALSGVLALEPQIMAWAENLAKHNSILFLGRGMHYPIAMEGALKLKETSYIHADAYPAGEIKHGPLALVTDNLPIVAVVPADHLVDKMKSNIQEVRARGAQVYVFADASAQMTSGPGLQVISLPHYEGVLSPLLHVVPLQLLAYHTACARGTDVDKPRNLAKSVTVE
ncbi:glutamine--fructose-6-phosphate transaminase (isomerizing) [Orrella sp. 11846]|uniref:glutamine--fructose-6-phosphate transaminase (isomerizing) n=1 Tax=Orrella sp. 11846 TaxID=3409913 RepID=UPI003B5ABB05